MTDPKAQRVTFLVAETRPGSFSYHLRIAESTERKAVCGDLVEVDTAIPVEAWEVRTDKAVITQWCKRCKTAVAAAVAQAELRKLLPKPGDVIFFSRCRTSLDGKDVGFKGHGFGVLLGIVPPGIPEPPPLLLPRIMGEMGYLKFDDVIDFFGKEVGEQCVEKFKDKYYGKIVAEPAAPSNPSEQVSSALRLVDSSGKPIELIPGPKKETH